MADPHWTSYVGMATGLIGSILGYLGLRRSQKIKRLDLRIELRKQHGRLISLIEEGPHLIDRSENSKMRRAGAEGGLRGGNLQAWRNECDRDKERFTEISNETPPKEEDFRKRGEKEIEDLILEVERLLAIATALTDKYKTSIADDQEASREKFRLANERYNKT